MRTKKSRQLIDESIPSAANFKAVSQKNVLLQPKRQ